MNHTNVQHLLTVAIKAIKKNVALRHLLPTTNDATKG